jgi:hypothetical protein
MWIMSEDGFVSAVFKDGKLQLRARDRESLIRLGFKGRRIKSNQGTDYPFRVYTTHEEFGEIVARQIAAITYDNFKNQAKKTRGRRYADCLGNVWMDMLRMEPRDALKYVGNGSWRKPKKVSSAIDDDRWWETYRYDSSDAQKLDRDNPLLSEDALDDAQLALLEDLPVAMHAWTEDQWNAWLSEHPEGV